MTNMKLSEVGLRVEYGEPQFSKIQFDDDGLLVAKVLVPGLIDDALIINVDPKEITVEHEIDEPGVPKFRFTLYRTSGFFGDIACNKTNGVLVILATTRKLQTYKI